MIKTALIALLVLAPALAAQGTGYRENVRPVMPANHQKINPSLPWVSEFGQPAIYAKWWKEIAACEKRVLPEELTARVKFVQINSRLFYLVDDPHQLYGLTDPVNGVIYVAYASYLEESVVKHEMAHVLDVLNFVDEGKDFHPPDTFETCGLHTTHP